jgi:PASTA domain
VLGIGGKFAGAKGMVPMPDLSNLSPDQALAALQNAGLRRRNLGSSTTNNSGLGNKVFAQSVSAGTLIDYETEIDYSYYIYVAPTPDPTPQPTLCGDWYPADVTQIKYGSNPAFECTGGDYSRPFVEEENRKNYCLNGIPTGAYLVDETSRRKIYVGANEQRDGICGYVKPVSTCTPEWKAISYWTGDCINGSQLVATRYRNSCTGEEEVISATQSCCVSTTILVSSWKGSCISCYRQTAVRYRDSCSGTEWVVNGSEYCCSGGGGGGGSLVAL